MKEGGWPASDPDVVRLPLFDAIMTDERRALVADALTPEGSSWLDAVCVVADAHGAPSE